MSLKYTTSSSSWALKCTDLPQFDALQAQAEYFRTDDKLHLRNLCNDSARCAGLMATHASAGTRKIILDYSRQRVTGETMELLFDLADAVGLTERREAMRSGVKINLTEGRPVLHHVLRMPSSYHFVMKDENGNSNVQEGMDVLTQIHDAREQVREFSERIRSGIYKSVRHRPFRNVVVIGAGGFCLGTECVVEGLKAEAKAEAASAGRTIRFITDVDPVDFHRQTSDLDPAETLVIVIGKTFTATQTMLNARTIKEWLVRNLALGGITEKEIVAKHMVAVSCAPTRCMQFGIRDENIFTIWEWLNPRFSVWSAAGLLPLCIHFSYTTMRDFLEGAHDMDEHFFKAPLRDNIPVIMGLIGVWNSTFLGYACKAILPYSQALRKFIAHVQHVDMESNGKRVALDGTDLLHRSGEVVFGESGINCENTFLQLLHQGRAIPADFIGFMESQRPLDLPGEAVSNHDELMSHFFALPDALSYGKTLMDLIQEGVPEPLREHMVLTGNRPSSSLLLTKLDAFSLGQLMSLYEQRAAVQGFIWGINSFDHYGTELNAALAKHVRSQLSASRKTGASVQGFNSSTSALLEHYLSYAKFKE